MATERLQVILELVTGKYRQEAQQAATSTQQIARSSDQAGTSTRNLGGRFEGLAATAKVAVAGAATAAVVGFAKSSISAAKDLGESINAVEVVFGDAADTITGFGQISAQTVGLSTSTFQQMASQTGQLLQGMGLDADTAAESTIRLTQRAADMASVMNTDVDQALGAIQSALQGQSEPIRKFIGSFSVAELQAYAVEKGMIAAGESMDETTKALATMEFIMDKTNRMAGDFIQTSDELANSQRVAAAEFENAQARFGEAAQAPAAFLVNLGSDILQGLQVMGLFGSTARDATIESVHMSDAINNITDALKEGDDPMTALADSLLHLARNGDLTSDEFRALAAAAGLSEDQFGDFAAIVLDQAENMGLSQELIDELAGALGVAGDAADTAAPKFGILAGEMNQIPSGIDGELRGIGEEAGSAVPSIQDMAEAIRDVATARLEATDPAFAAIQAQQRADEALAEAGNVRDAVGEGEASYEDLQLAIAEAAEAAMEADAANAALGANADQHLRPLQDAIDYVVEELDLANIGASDLLEALGVIDGTDVSFRIEATMDAADRALLSGIASGRLGGPELSMGGASPHNLGRQHGGPVTAGRPYVVGEAGPELMIPAQGGAVISNGNLRALAEAMTGVTGGGMTINFQRQDPHTDAQLVGALRAVQRRMETL